MVPFFLLLFHTSVLFGVSTLRTQNLWNMLFPCFWIGGEKNNYGRVEFHLSKNLTSKMYEKKTKPTSVVS